MKKLFFTVAVLLGTLLSQAQVTINLTAQPLWGPTGYNHVDYYYLPDIDTYYSVADRQYVYQNNNQWAFSRSLPSKYSSYKLYDGYKVVLNGEKPYLNWKNDRVKYASYKGKKGQSAIKYSKDTRYTQVIHTNKNGVPPGQAKKIAPRSNQQVIVAGSNGKANGQSNGKANGKGNGKAKGKQ